MSEFDQHPDRPLPGTAIELEPGIRCVLADNPSPMTYWGTNTYIIGTGNVAVIDPGPEDHEHLKAIIRATLGEAITHILITHAHMDHSPLARQLSEHTGAPILAFGPALAGRSPTMESLARQGLVGGGEGLDTEFAPDRELMDGEKVTGDDWELTTLWTPGHFAGHLSFATGDAIFSGDHVMDWASTLISPPDGDLTAFMESCERLRDRNPRVLYAGHGAPITKPAQRIDWLMAHRRSREDQILAELSQVPVELRQLTRRIYHDTPETLLPAAERNVLAHLIDLENRQKVRALPRLSLQARFMRC